MRHGFGLSLTGSAARGGRWSPAALFRPGDMGLSFDPLAPGSLSQDAAGAIPVTGPGQPVGLVRDLSGSGLHAVQPVSAARPTLESGDGRWYLAFDGVDDWLLVGSFAWGSGEFTLVAAVHKASDAAQAVLLEFSPSWSINAGAFSMQAPVAAGGASFGLTSRGSAGTPVATGSGFPAPTTNVVTGIGRISTNTAVLRVDGAQVAATASSQGSGNYGTHPLYIGRRGGVSNPFSGRIYGLMAINRVLSAPELAQVEGWMAARAGVSP